MTGEEPPVTFVQRTSLGVPAIEVEQVEGLENRPVSVGPAPFRHRRNRPAFAIDRSGTHRQASHCVPDGRIMDRGVLSKIREGIYVGIVPTDGRATGLA